VFETTCLKRCSFRLKRVWYRRLLFFCFFQTFETLFFLFFLFFSFFSFFSFSSFLFEMLSHFQFSKIRSLKLWLQINFEYFFLWLVDSYKGDHRPTGVAQVWYTRGTTGHTYATPMPQSCHTRRMCHTRRPAYYHP
jgi:hypothetical protein